MRAAKVPASVAVTAKGVHYVVSTVNGSSSFQRYQQHHHPTPAHPLAPFRFTSLLPEDWSALLRMCRRLTHPAAAFNFSSPGDTAQHAPAQAKGDTSQVAVENHAYMHIVERVADDFVPNNMIYHQLQKFHLLPGDELRAASSTDGAGSAASMVAFTRLVTELQGQSAGAPEDVSAQLLNDEDSAQAALSAAAKQQLDPLYTNADAVAKSAANHEQLRAYVDAVSKAASGVPASPALPPFMFTFYPYPVSAAVSIPYCSRHFCVMVNLKPIVPNHLMVVPIRCVGTMHGLTEEEVEDWGRVMRCTINVLEHLRRAYVQEQRQAGETASQESVEGTPSVGNYSIAVQQGALAGQTVDHMHVHVIPFDPCGKLAGEPETDEEEQRRRPPRTPAVMQAETDALRPLFARCAAAENGRE